MSNPEKIISVAAEGEGGSLYRARRDDGSWLYWLAGTSMSGFFDDEEPSSFETERVGSLEEALALIGSQSTWTCFFPQFVHPDVAAEVWRLVEAAETQIPEHLRRSYAYRRPDWFDACHPDEAESPMRRRRGPRS